MTRDYHDFTTIDTSVADRKKLNVGDWYTNAAECRNCGKTVRSCNAHHYVQCDCGRIAVDGGSWYLKRTGDPSQMIDRSVPFNDRRVKS